MGLMGEDETVKHVALECVKYTRDKNEMMQAVVRELENVRVETRKEWMVDGVVAGTVWRDE